MSLPRVGLLVATLTACLYGVPALLGAAGALLVHGPSGTALAWTWEAAAAGSFLVSCFLEVAGMGLLGPHLAHLVSAASLRLMEGRPRQVRKYSGVGYCGSSRTVWPSPFACARIHCRVRVRPVTCCVMRRPCE
jgi:hypothetical protein